MLVFSNYAKNHSSTICKNLCQSCQCLVCLASCRNSRQERQSESGQMSSKTILISLSIIRCGGEKSVHGRPSWELALLLIRIGSQTAWEAVRLDFIDNKDKIIAKDYELHGRCDFLHYVL